MPPHKLDENSLWFSSNETLSCWKLNKKSKLFPKSLKPGYPNSIVTILILQLCRTTSKSLRLRKNNFLDNLNLIANQKWNFPSFSHGKQLLVWLLIISTVASVVEFWQLATPSRQQLKVGQVCRKNLQT